MKKTVENTQLVMSDRKVATSLFKPMEVLEQAKKAALALKTVVDQKSKKVVINGEPYLEYEDWQTLGWFYGVTAGAVETQEIWRDNKLVGYKAKAQAYKDGIRISDSEASCMRDEFNWKDKPEFQLKSMAQTRACSKVLGNVLRWVAVLAGYKGTPAEEMNGETSERKVNPDLIRVNPVNIGSNKCPECGTIGKFHKKGCQYGV